MLGEPKPRPYFKDVASASFFALRQARYDAFSDMVVVGGGGGGGGRWWEMVGDGERW